MKHMYEQPAMQEMELEMVFSLAISNIGEGGSGQQGDVKGFGSFDESGNDDFDEDLFE